MNVMDLPAELAESSLEMAIALLETAQGRHNLFRPAAVLHQCYVRALMPAPSGFVHERRWRRFVAGLDMYLRHCPTSAQACRLQAIVAENADLLEPIPALAS